MKKQKQLLSLVLSAAMVIGLTPVNLTGTKASAAEVGAEAEDQGEKIPDLPKESQKGTFGPNSDEKDRFTWELSTEGVLTIGCTADMTTAESGLPDKTAATVEELPWYEWHAAIKKVVFNGAMTSVGACNFAVKSEDTGYVSLKEIDITNASSLTVLGANAFADCTALDTVTGGKGLDQFNYTRVGGNAFSNTGFTTLTLSCDTISSTGVFSGCQKLTSITAANLKQIDGPQVFMNCPLLTTIKMDKLQTITAASTFRGCTSLQEIHLPALKEIKPPSNLCGGTFRDCTALKTVDLPVLETVVNDNHGSGGGIFDGCTALEKISLPKYKDGDSRAMFYGCTKLTSVDLPNMETNIGTEMFKNCSSLRVVTLLKATGTKNGSAFYGCTNLIGVNAPLSEFGSGSDFELLEHLTWLCIGGYYSSFHNTTGYAHNVTDPGSNLPPRQKVDRVYFNSIKETSAISNTYFSTIYYKDPITFYVTKADESKFANVAKANNPNVTLKVVEDSAAMQKLIEKERVLILEGPEEVQATEKPKDVFKVKWQDLAGKDTTATTPAPDQTPVPAATPTPTPAPTPAGIDVSFKVVEQGGDTPIEGAKFTMTGTARVTVSEDSAKGGKYKSSAKVKDGTYTVTVKKTGEYSSVEVKVTIQDGKIQNPDGGAGWTLDTDGSIKIQMTKVMDSLKFKLQDSVNSNALKDATITMKAASGALDSAPSTVTAVPEEEGSYQAAKVADGTYTVTVSKKNYETKTAQVIIKGAQLQDPADGSWEKSGNDVLIKMTEAKTTLTFKVTSDGESALTGAKVALVPTGSKAEADKNESAAAGADGTCTVSKVADGTYTASVSCEGYNTKSFSITVTEGKLGNPPSSNPQWERENDTTANVQLALLMSKLKFKVTDGDKLSAAELSDVKVTMKMSGAAPEAVPASGSTIAGVWETTNVADGTYAVTATLDGYNERSVNLTIKDGKLTLPTTYDKWTHSDAAGVDVVELKLYKLMPELTVKIAAMEDENTPVKPDSLTYPSSSGFTNPSNGVYKATNLKDGSYSFSNIKLTGYTTKSLTITVTDGKVVESSNFDLEDDGKTVKIVLGKPLSLVAKVLGTDNQPVACTTFNVTRVGSRVTSTKTADGVYQFTNLQAASYSISVTPSNNNYNSISGKSFTIKNGKVLSSDDGIFKAADNGQTLEIHLSAKLKSIQVKVHLKDKGESGTYLCDQVTFNGKDMTTETEDPEESTAVVYSATGLTVADATNISLSVSKDGYNTLSLNNIVIANGKLGEPTGTAKWKNEDGVIVVTLSKILPQLTIKAVEKGKSDPIACDSVKWGADQKELVVAAMQTATSYTVDTVADNSYSLTITEAGYNVWSGSIKIEDGAVVEGTGYKKASDSEVQVELNKPMTLKLKLESLDGETGETTPIKGATLQLTSGAGDTMKTINMTEPKSDGTYEAKDVTNGSWSLKIDTADGKNAWYTTKDYNQLTSNTITITDGACTRASGVVLEADSTDTLKCTLTKCCTVKVKVVDKDGEDTCLTDAKVFVGSYELEYKTDHYEGTVPNNTYEVKVTKDGYQDYSARSAITVSSGKVTTVLEGGIYKAEMVKKASLTINVKDNADSKTVTAAKVTLTKSGKDVEVKGGNGVFTATLDDGTYSLTASAETYRSVTDMSITVTGGKITAPEEAASGTLDVKLLKIAAISITVKNPKGVPVTDANVLLKETKGETIQAVHTENGVYTASPIDGTYTVSITAEGYLDDTTAKQITVDNKGVATNGTQEITLQLVPVFITYHYYKDALGLKPAVDDDPTKAPEEGGYYYIQAVATGNGEQMDTVSNILPYTQLWTWDTEYYNLDNTDWVLTIKKDIGDQEWKTAADVPWDGERQYIKKVVLEGTAQTMTTIPAYAFYNLTAMTELALPKTVKTVKQHALDGCSSWEYTSELTDMTLETYAFNNCKKMKGTLTVKDGVTELPAYCLRGVSLSSITVPDSVTTFGNYCFAGNDQITTIHIPEKITEIPNYFAQDCTALTDITLPDTVTKIGSDAFERTAVAGSINFPTALTSIGNTAFSNVKGNWKDDTIDLTACTSLASLGSYAFGYASAKTVKLSDAIKTIGSYCFQSMNLDYMKLPNGEMNATGSTGAMNSVYVKDLDFPENFTVLPQKFFEGTSMDVIIIPKTVKTIEGGTFSYCRKLKYVEFENDSYTKETLKKMRSSSRVGNSGTAEELYPDLLFDRTSESGDYIVVSSGTTYERLQKLQVLEEGGCIDWSQVKGMTYASYQSQINVGQNKGWAGHLYKPEDIAGLYADFQGKIDKLKEGNYTPDAWTELQTAVTEANNLISGEDLSNYEKFSNINTAKLKVLEAFKKIFDATAERAKALQKQASEEDYDTEDPEYDYALWDFEDVFAQIDRINAIAIEKQDLEDMADTEKVIQDRIAAMEYFLLPVDDELASIESLLTEAEELSETDYTEESWQTLQEAIAEASEVSPYLTKVTQALEKLQKAMDGLKKVGEEDTPAHGENTPAPGENTPAPGGNTTPAPGGNTPAPGGNTPAPGGNTPAPGTNATPAPGGSTPGTNVTPAPNNRPNTIQNTVTAPKKVTLKKVKSSKKKTLLVQWKKVSGATGYKVQIAKDKKFKKGKKTYTIKKAKTTKKTIKKLKSKKKYFVRVCAYKKASGKTVTGKWSKVKSAKVK